MGRRGPAPQMKVSTDWSPELAYAIGLIATDGNLSIDGRHINFTSKDKDLVETFRRCLRIDNIIGTKSRGGSSLKQYFQVQFGDVHFYRWLLSVGLMPRKSLLLGPLAIPDHLFFDFLRGCFDGDGTIYAYWDPRWQSSYMIYINFVSASRNYLLWLQSIILRLAGTKGHFKPGKRSLILAFAKRDTYVLFSKMFYKEKLPCLQRKFVKAKIFFEIDRTHNETSARVSELVDDQG
ncbi:MAG: LAGLIDADG family homing endonuclease [bacterium]|nr:LAGLIDADG family homing endonuclease [bacterium]MDZ4296351.1 LAGLIDADG family homing endonuclease [Patescibacteria group bacterium]